VRCTASLRLASPRYIAAELTGTFQLMRDRQMDVMESPHDSSPLADVLMLTGFSFALTVVSHLALMWKAMAMEDSAQEEMPDGASTEQSRGDA